MPKVILVTGSSRGIGRATALLAARQGYLVGINYHKNQKAAREVLDEVKALGSDGILLQADVSKEAEIVRLFVELDASLGTLHALVNNAGMLVPAARAETYTAERLAKLFTLNVSSYFLCCREAIKRMSTQHGGKGGSIVNVSSAASRTGSAGVYVDYAATKGAIDTMTYGLAQELAEDGIRVNAVRPGFIDTDMHLVTGIKNRAENIAQTVPFRRNGTAEEVAHAIMHLVSDEASYTSGALLDVTGAR